MTWSGQLKQEAASPLLTQAKRTCGGSSVFKDIFRGFCFEIRDQSYTSNHRERCLLLENVFARSFMFILSLF